MKRYKKIIMLALSIILVMQLTVTEVIKSNAATHSTNCSTPHTGVQYYSSSASEAINNIINAANYYSGWYANCFDKCFGKGTITGPWCVWFVRKAAQDAGIGNLFSTKGEDYNNVNAMFLKMTDPNGKYKAKGFVVTDTNTNYKNATYNGNYIFKNAEEVTSASFEPQPGDLMFIQNYPSSTGMMHVVLVWKVEGNRVYFIDGNGGSGSDYTQRAVRGKSANKYYPKNARRENGWALAISGYVRPNYTSLGSNSVYDLYLNPNQGCFSNGLSTTIKMDPQLIYGGGHWWDVSSHIPTKEGYFFNGWYTEPVGGTRVYDYEGKACNEGHYFLNNTYVYPGNLTVYAQWSKYYDLYLDPNGGSFSNGTTEVKKASPQLIYEGGHWWDVSGHTPTKAGCTFKGWFTEATGGVKVYNADGSACNEGKYFSNNLYVNPGDLKVYAQWSETEKPVITDVWVDEVSNQGYTVYCKATDNTQILKVSFATWTEYNDQDDLKNEWWDKNAVMQPVSDNIYAFRVNTAEHNEEAGLYITDVYAYDTNYNYVMQRVQVNIDKTSPIISAYIENVDATGYTVVCKAVDDVEMARVCFPTWTTANGQDDLNPDWYNNCAVVGKGNDGVYTYRVNVSDHNNESGEYETHIYAYDISGNYIQGRAPKAQVPKGLPFPDVKPGAWYYNSVSAVYEVGLMNGRADGTFGPELNLTRAEVATVLYNKENKPYVAYVNCFSDVKDGMWYSAPISWAYRKGIASGYGNGKFGVGDNISREQMAQMLYAYAKMKGYDISYTDGGINQYSDSAKVSSWAKPAMNWAISKGIMSGKGSGSDLSKYKLEPQGSTTRAECAAMLKNFMDAYGR